MDDSSAAVSPWTHWLPKLVTAIAIVSLGVMGVGCGGPDADQDTIDPLLDAGTADSTTDTGLSRRDLRVRIVTAPNDIVSELPVEVEFELVHPEVSAQFECRFNGQGWQACESPKQYGQMDPGFNKMTIRARNTGQDITGPYASSDWTYVIAPQTSIDEHPNRVTTDRDAYFAYSASPQYDLFECRVDDSQWGRCPDEEAYVTVEFGEHTLEIRASYRGVVDPTPASYTWTVTDEVDTGIDSHPDQLSRDDHAEFEFSGTGVDHFECKLDSQPWQTCSSPITYDALADGDHDFRVRTIGDFERRDDSPANFQWTIDTHAPTVTITSSPPNPASSLVANFAFEANASAALECRLDGQDWSPCTSPKESTVSQSGEHTFEVRATDAAGNTSQPASRTWQAEVRWQDITAGFEHTCGIQADGSLWCWGRGRRNLLGFFDESDDTLHYATPQHVGSSTNWREVDAGGSHTCAIKTDGTLWCWGSSRHGQLGIDSDNLHSQPVQVGEGTTWDSVSATNKYTCATKSDDTLWCWGANDDGQLGDGTQTERDTPTQIGAQMSWKSVDAARYATCAVATNGTLWCWGSNESGQLGDGTTTDHRSPVQVGTATSWTDVNVATSQGYIYGFACGVRENGSLWCWGSDRSNQLGNGPSEEVHGEVHAPTRIGTDADWQHVVAAVGTACATKTDGTLWCWGANTNGVTGITDRGSLDSPTQVGVRSDWATFDLDGKDDATRLDQHTCGLSTGGTLRCWGTNHYGVLGTGHLPERPRPARVLSSSDWATLSAGNNHNCAIKTDGTLWCWGTNTFYQLGINNRRIYDYPKQQATANDWASVAAGGVNSCGIKTDGTLWCWGKSLSGELGQGDGLGYAANVTTPSQVGSDDTWQMVRIVSKYLNAFPARGQTCAIKQDGSLWCWGDNSGGLLGIGASPSSQKTPALVDNGPWMTLSMTTNNRCAIKTDGTLWCWGSNFSGNLGVGTSQSHASPTQVGTASSWTDVANASNSTCATRSDGTLWCWGANGDGQLGNNSDSPSTSPIQIGAGTDWTGVSAAAMAHRVCATRNDQSLWCWGKDDGESLGDGPTPNYQPPPQSTPTSIGPDTDWQPASLGERHSCALDADGGLWCWGSANKAQLGMQSYLRVDPYGPIP